MNIIFYIYTNRYFTQHSHVIYVCSYFTYYVETIVLLLKYNSLATVRVLV